jgi:hypothetical protein
MRERKPRRSMHEDDQTLALLSQVLQQCTSPA